MFCSIYESFKVLKAFNCLIGNVKNSIDSIDNRKKGSMLSFTILRDDFINSNTYKM